MFLSTGEDLGLLASFSIEARLEKSLRLESGDNQQCLGTIRSCTQTLDMHGVSGAKYDTLRQRSDKNWPKEGRLAEPLCPLLIRAMDLIGSAHLRRKTNERATKRRRS